MLTPYLCVMAAMVVMATAVSDCVQMATFNTKLTVDRASDRPGRIYQALLGSSADVICLQEVWLRQDVSDLLDVVQGTYSHHFSKIHTAVSYFPPLGTFDCNTNEAAIASWTVIRCTFLDSDCTHKSGTDLLNCLRSCESADAEWGGATCRACVEANLVVSLDNAVQACFHQELDFTSEYSLNAPGLMLLSKQALASASYTAYHSQAYQPAVETGYIRAELADGKVVVCTGLTDIDPSLESDAALVETFGDVEGQNAAEISTLGADLIGVDHVLMGGFNVGPQVAAKSVVAQTSNNYDALIALGYSAPYVDVGDCTLCQSNTLSNTTSNTLVDQVLVTTSVFATDSAQRVLDSSPPLSDHYGVQLQVCIP